MASRSCASNSATLLAPLDADFRRLEDDVHNVLLPLTRRLAAENASLSQRLLDEKRAASTLLQEQSVLRAELASLHRDLEYHREQNALHEAAATKRHQRKIERHIAANTYISSQQNLLKLTGVVRKRSEVQDARIGYCLAFDIPEKRARKEFPHYVSDGKLYLIQKRRVEFSVATWIRDASSCRRSVPDFLEGGERYVLLTLHYGGEKAALSHQEFSKTKNMQLWEGDWRQPLKPDGSATFAIHKFNILSSETTPRGRAFYMTASVINGSYTCNGRRGVMAIGRTPDFFIVSRNTDRG